MSSFRSPSATPHRPHERARRVPDFVEEPAEIGPPPPRTAVLLGLAFGASAGLATVLYLIFV